MPQPTDHPPDKAETGPPLLARIDVYQQRHRWLGFPFAVFQKFRDDQAGNLAALIAYYTFFSIFPLLLVLVTVLGYALAGNPGLAQQVFSSVVGQLPIIGQSSPAQPLTGSPLALALGLALAIWSGLGAAQVTQRAVDTVYGVAPVEAPGFAARVLRSLELVVVAGGGLALTTVLQGVLSGEELLGLRLGALGAVAGAVAGIALNTVLFTYLFQRATSHPTRWRDVIIGAAVAAVAWYVLQKVGTELVDQQVTGAQATYGTFAVVIGLLFWFYLLAQLTLYCVEINVVRARGLWPRGLPSLLQARSTTPADREAVESYPERDRQTHNVEIEARVTTDTDDTEPAPGRW